MANLLKYNQLSENIKDELKSKFPNKQIGDFIYTNTGDYWRIDEVRVNKTTLDSNKPVWKHYPWPNSFKQVYTPEEFFKKIKLSEKMIEYVNKFNVLPAIDVEGKSLAWSERNGYKVDSFHPGWDFILEYIDFNNPDPALIDIINKRVRHYLPGETPKD